MHVGAGTVEPIALAQGEGEALWFLGVLADGAASGGRFAVIEHLALKGAGSPLHVHTREDEWFYIMEGELTFLVGRAGLWLPPAPSCTGRAEFRTSSW